jgi:plasmid stabilization system protein ParE
VTKLRWTTQAVEDEAIRKFIANDSDAYADLVVARLLEAVGRLELFPRSGRIIPELADPQLREIIESPQQVDAPLPDELARVQVLLGLAVLSPRRNVRHPSS